MGANARWMGFSGPLTHLLDPKQNLEISCKFFSTVVLKKNPKLEDAIAAYNAGSPRRKADGTYRNQQYVDKVLKTMERLRA